MGVFIVCFLLLMGLSPVSALGGNIRAVELKDGSVIRGEMVSSANGVYKLRSESLGTITLDQSKIQNIRMAGQGGDSGRGNLSEIPTSELLRALRERTMGNRDLRPIISSLENDPDFQEVVNDPEVLRAVDAGNLSALISNPKCLKLLTKPAVRELFGRIVMGSFEAPPPTDQ